MLGASSHHSPFFQFHFSYFTSVQSIGMLLSEVKCVRSDLPPFLWFIFARNFCPMKNSHEICKRCHCLFLLSLGWHQHFDTLTASIESTTMEGMNMEDYMDVVYRCKFCPYTCTQSPEMSSHVKEEHLQSLKTAQKVSTTRPLPTIQCNSKCQCKVVIVPDTSLWWVGYWNAET